MDLKLIIILMVALPLINVTQAGTGKPVDSVLVSPQGIRVTFYDAEFYFNATNGGEITEYYDLIIDPSRSRNLANIDIFGRLQGNLYPLFTSAIYNPYIQSDYSTGGDYNAKVSLLEETNDSITVFTASRIMNRIGLTAKDSYNNPVYINTSWTFDKQTGLIFVERTFSTGSSFNLPQGWRWYPFYFTRNNGFTNNGTFYFFNTTFTKTVTTTPASYENRYNLFPVFPHDDKGIFGVAMPFVNKNIEGDGTHNAIVIYNEDELVNVTEWKSDTSNNLTNWNITWAGAVHEFNKPVNITTHTYHAVVRFTHEPVNEKNVQKYARYVDSIYPLMEINLTTNKDVYRRGEPYTISVSGTSNQNLSNITSKLTAANDTGIYFEKKYKTYSYTKGETFSALLADGYIQANDTAGNRTFSFQLVSQTGAIIATDSKSIIITT